MESPERPSAGGGISRLLLSTALLTALVGAGYVALYGWPFSEPAPAQVASAAEPGDTPATSLTAPAALPVPVETAIVIRSELVMKITATGVAEATRQLEAQAGTPGIIVELPAVEGRRVEAGDLLAAVDDTELRLKVQTQRESLVRAMSLYSEKQAFLSDASVMTESMREMMAAQESAIGGVLSPEQFRSVINDPRFDALFDTITRDEVMAAQDRLISERANYETAALDLERAHTLAPFAGQIAKVEVVVGQRVTAGTKLLTLVDANPIRVRVNVLESEAGLVREGRRAEVRFAAYPGEVFHGSIEAISPLVDSETKTLEVIVALANEQLRLKPGMFAEITLDTEIFGDRLLVPATAVLLRDDRPMVFAVEDGRSRWIYIRKGLENRDWVEVLEGVEAGDEIVTLGHYSLAHDAAVRVVNGGESEQG